jgi:hypothetical protein
MKMSFERRVRFERNTVSDMIDYYCKRHHQSAGICEKCLSVKEYAFGRIDKCPLMPNKPTCSNCHIHCYKNSMRDQVREIMRFSGPRMIYLSPGKAILYLAIKKKFLMG